MRWDSAFSSGQINQAQRDQLPVDLDDLINERKGLQGRLRTVQDSLALSILKNDLSNSNDWKAQARMTSVSQFGAGDVYYAIPSDYCFTLNNTSFQIKLASTLGCQGTLDSFASHIATCPSSECRKEINRPSRKGHSFKDQHVFNCKVGGGVITRHNLVAKQTNLMFRAASHSTKYEPRASHSAMGKGGPDIEVRKDDEIYYVDVAIVNPVQRAYIGTSRDHPLIAASSREEAKVSKYAALSHRTGRRVLGAAMETSGAIGPCLKSLISQCEISFEEQHGPFRKSASAHWSRRSFSQFWRQRLSIALAKGNGCIASCIRLSRDTAHHLSNQPKASPPLIRHESRTGSPSDLSISSSFSSNPSSPSPSPNQTLPVAMEC